MCQWASTGLYCTCHKLRADTQLSCAALSDWRAFCALSLRWPAVRAEVRRLLRHGGEYGAARRALTEWRTTANTEWALTSDTIPPRWPYRVRLGAAFARHPARCTVGRMVTSLGPRRVPGVTAGLRERPGHQERPAEWPGSAADASCSCRGADELHPEPRVASDAASNRRRQQVIRPQSQSWDKL